MQINLNIQSVIVMKKIVCAILFPAVFFALNVYAQNDNSVVKNAVSGLKTLMGDHVIEKAYLHFDKPYYAAGDTIYFKAYVTLGEQHELSKASAVLHVDLIDPGNSIVNSIKLPLVNGVGWGDFSLPFSYPKGNYRIRAYTRYMQNAPDYFFDQTLQVGSLMTSKSAAQNPETGQKVDLQFFPEGGQLVTAMISKVAFKAVGPDGLGINLRGVVLDNKGQPVATFTPSHLGMGSFYFLPEAGKTYSAKVTFADGSQNTFSLPAAVEKGIALAVKDTLDKISIEIHSNQAYLQENMNKQISVVVYGSGTVNTVNTRLDSRRLGFDIPNNQFPTGVVLVTLFSQNGEPLSERLVFVQNPDLVNLTVNSNKSSYSKRERVSVEVKALDKGAGTQGHFSVSVIDENKVPFNDDNATTILSYLLLSADLKGHIEQPNYYFSHNTDKTTADLDALMLTQGYRRFIWKQLLEGNAPAFSYQPEKTIMITGSAKTKSGTPAKGLDVMLVGAHSTLVDKTDNNGKFVFENLPPFSDSTRLILQATGSTTKKNTTIFTVDADNAGPAVENNNTPLPAGELSQDMKTYLGSNDMASRPAVNGTHPSQVVSGDEISNSSSLVTALNGRLLDVNFVQGLPYLKGASGKDPMLVVINGKIAGGYVNLDDINPGDVAKVEVLKGSSAEAYGVYGKAGVLSITSRSAATGISTGIVQDASYKYNSNSLVKQKNAAYVNTKDNYRSSNLGGSGHADQVVKADAFKNQSSVSIALTGILTDVQFINGVPYLSSSKVVVNKAESGEPMYVILDGNPMDMSSNGIDILNPLDIETVELLKSATASIYGMNGGAGVLVITTRQRIDNSDIAVDKTSLGNLTFKPKALYKAREFYSPKYETAGSGSGQQDLRSTILWIPELVTDKDGAAKFEYYNADGRGSYRLVIEGIDEKGNIGRQVYRYKVD
jgi:hypothetical protein